jgi:hypothetical protein
MLYVLNTISSNLKPESRFWKPRSRFWKWLLVLCSGSAPIMVAYRCFSFLRCYTHIIHYGIFENTNGYIILNPQNRLNIITWSRFCLCVVSSGSNVVIFVHTFDDNFWNNFRWNNYFWGFIIVRNANNCIIVYPQH